MSFPQYQKYKNTSLEWLREVPEHWEIKAIKQVVATPVTDGPHETPNFIGDGVPFVSAEAVAGGVINFGKVRGYISEEDHSRYSRKYRPRMHDIFLVKSGATTGVTAIVETDKSFNVWSPLAAIRVGPGADPYFVLNFLRSKNFQEAITLNWSFGTQQNIGMGVIQNLALALPPMPEQSAIAAFLDREIAKIDALAEEQKRLIDLLKEKRQASISQAVTKGIDPNAPMKDSSIEWLGEVPKHWQVQRLGAVFCEVVDVGSEELPILSVSIHDGVSDKELREDELERKVTRSDDRTKYKRVRPGDLVYNMMRAWQGGFGAVNVHGMVSPAYVVARPNDNLCTPFVEYLLRTPNAVEEMRRYSRGVTDFRLRLYWDEFKTLVVAFPPVAEQLLILELIEKQTSKMSALISEAETAIAILHERRSALISAAVTGKIDVREAATATHAHSDSGHVRLLVAAEIIERLSQKANFGRVKLQKLAYLTETHADVRELQGSYMRAAAGPLDRDMIAEMETQLQRAGHISVGQPGGHGKQVVYKFCGRTGAYRDELTRALGERKARFLGLIKDLGDLETKSVEAIATLYAVWNDALIDGQTPTDDSVVSGVLEEWHPDKAKKFRAAELHEWLGWMRRHDLVPQGKGPKTTTGRLFL